MANTSEEYRFYLSDNYERLLIEEPDGIQDIQSVLARDMDAHGVFFEFTDSDIKLRFCGDGRDFLESHYQDGGTDVDVLFAIEKRVNVVGEWKEVYSSYVKYTEREIDETWFSCPIEQISELQDLKNRIKTKVDLTQPTGIDGGQLTPINEHLFGMHSKVIREETDVSCDNSVTARPENSDLGLPDPDGGDRLFVIHNFNIQTMTEIEEYFTYPLQVTPLFASETVQDTLKYTFLFNKSGNFTIDYIKLIYNIDFGSSLLDTDYEYQLYIQKNSETPMPLGGSYTGNIDSPSNSFDNILVNRADTDIEFNIQSGDALYIYGIMSFENYNGFTEGHRFYIDMVEGQLQCTFDGIQQNSLSTGYSLYNAAYRLSESLMAKSDIMQSDILSTGCLKDLYLFDGYRIRNFEGRSLYMNFDTFFTSVNSLFALGYGFEVTSGVRKLRIEHFTHFYQDGEIIDLGDVDDYKEETEPDLIYNTLAFKFKKFANDEEERNTIDDFHTESEWLTTIRKNKQEFDKTSDYIMSPFLIETTRRKRFEEEPTESFKYDDDLFLIQGISISDTEVVATFDEYDDTITVPLTFYDNVLSFSESFTVTNSDNNDGDYTYIFGDIVKTDTEVIIPVNQNITDLEENSTCNIGYPNLDLKAERLEAYDSDGSVSGLIDASSSYNLRWTLKRSLLMWGQWIRSSLHYEPNGYVKNTFFKNNADLVTNLDSDECLIGQESTDVDEDEQIFIDALGNPIWSPDIITFQKKLSADEIIYIRDAHKNNIENVSYTEDELLNVEGNTQLLVNTGTNLLIGQNESVAESRNFGYISCRDFNGDKVGGYLLSMKFNIITEICEFELLKKADETTSRKQLESGFYKLLEDGSYKLLENG